MTGGRKRIYRKISIEPGVETYIPKNFYTKTTYITLLSKKFAPPPPYFAPVHIYMQVYVIF
ncbi:hypothetical protein Hanom_Chr07g00641141 [Helianthus anomalus]